MYINLKAIIEYDEKSMYFSRPWIHRTLHFLPDNKLIEKG